MPPEGAQTGLFREPEPREETLRRTRAWARAMLDVRFAGEVPPLPGALIPPGLELDLNEYEANAALPGAQDRYLDEHVRRACKHMLRALGERV